MTDDAVALTGASALSEKAVITHDQLARELHELKSRNETPIPLIEMSDALLSLDPRLSAKQKRRNPTRSWHGIGTVGSQGRLIAIGGRNGSAACNSDPRIISRPPPNYNRSDAGESGSEFSAEPFFRAGDLLVYILCAG